MPDPNKKRSSDRKSPGAKEFFDKQRFERNSARPKQRWVGGESVKQGGYWDRTIVVSQEN